MPINRDGPFGAIPLILKHMSEHYAVHVQYVFTGQYFVVAENEREARRAVLEECGLVMGGTIHSTLGDDLTDWNFDIHPETVIPKVETCNEEMK